MPSINHILCPVDFSAFSRHAVDHAARVAHHFGATLTVLFAYPPLLNVLPPIEAGGYVPPAYTPEDAAAVERSLTQFVAGVTYPVQALAVEGPPVQEILVQADRLGADLIVMGTHGRTGFDRAFLGSVTERILARSTRPVLVVPPRAADAAATGPDLYTRIVAAVDFSESSRRASAWAAELATASHADLLLVHVVPPVPRFQPVMMGAPASPEYQAAVRKDAHQHLAAMVAPARTATTVEDLVVDGAPADEVVRIAEERRADLIVAGAHAGPGGLLGFGSTASRLARSASCPVLIVRA